MQTYQELTEQRLVILIENEPLSNVYNQVIINKEQFKKISDLISSFYTKVGQQEEIETLLMTLNDEDITLPSGLTSCES